MKNNKGITLIALVVTIIVLLILAGVSIAMLTGQNGILSRASESSVTNAIGEAKDQVALTVSEAVADYYEVKYAKGKENKYTGLNNVANDNATTGTVALNNYIKTKVNALSVNGVTITATDASITIKSDENGTYTSTATLDTTGKVGAWNDSWKK